ncbi:hypothetical protein KM043_008966 [Ampulex compressa]|nr:hypothetical protein KM043_008966 [Ampulex compressa]
MIISRTFRLYKKVLQHTVSRSFTNDMTTVLPNAIDNEASSRIVWIDTELTGLDENTCHILEIACVVTDKNLTVFGDHLNLVIHQPENVLANMNSWCKIHLENNGLINESRASNISLNEAESRILTYLQKYVPKGKCPLAGNSVYMDRIFLKKYMPLVDEYLHYRIIDVSTISELIWRWNTDVQVSQPAKANKHRALSDVLDSIKQLSFYKEQIFTPTQSFSI